MIRIPCRFLALTALPALAACSADPSGPAGPDAGGSGALTGMALSAPIPAAPAGPGTTVYVSVAAGTMPGAATARVRVNGTLAGEPIVASGGFDPVAVAAGEGDLVEVTITDTAAHDTTGTGTVRRAPPPRVVRTSPLPSQADVPLNVRARVVFSAPMTPASIADGVRLFRGTEQVPATLVPVGTNGLVFDVQPAAALEPDTDYRLAIDATVTDVIGTAMAAAAAIPFTTGTTTFTETGNVRVVTTTSGERPDPDGYTFLGFANQPMTIGPVDTLLLTGLPIGEHVVGLGGLAINCRPAATNPSWVTVTARQTTEIEFAVTCASGVTLTVVTSTTGPDQDHDGYDVQVMHLGEAWSEIRRMAISGSAEFPDVLPGTYAVILLGVSPNCSHDRVDFPGFHVPVTIDGSDATATFPVTCLPSQQLAAVAGEGAESELWLVNSTGIGATRLTFNAALDEDPAWSPDGARLAFTSDRDGNQEVYVMNADGSNPQRLTSSPGVDAQPAWSPDGTRIAFMSARSGDAEIYVMNADGSDPVRLTTTPGPDLDPTWSPDSRRLAFSSARGGQAHVYTMEVDGTNQVQVTFTQGGFFEAHQPAWSPDGRSLVFIASVAGDAGTTVRDLQQVNPDGTGYRTFGVESVVGVTDPAWSADGRQVSTSWGRGCSTPCYNGLMLYRSSDGAMTGPMYYGVELTIEVRNGAWRP